MIKSHWRKAHVGYGVVYGLPRGGLIPAVILSHSLSIPMAKSLGHFLQTIATGQRGLLVDDICDSGKSLKEVYERHEMGIFATGTATLHYREGSVFTPQFFASKIVDKRWIVYPWESEATPQIQGYKSLQP